MRVTFWLPVHSSQLPLVSTEDLNLLKITHSKGFSYFLQQMLTVVLISRLIVEWCCIPLKAWSQYSQSKSVPVCLLRKTWTLAAAMDQRNNFLRFHTKTNKIVFVCWVHNSFLYVIFTRERTLLSRGHKLIMSSSWEFMKFCFPKIMR